MRFSVKQFCISVACYIGVVAATFGSVAAVSADPIDYTPSLDIIPTATFVTGADQKVIPGPGVNPLQNGDIKVNFVFTQPLAKRINFQFEQDRSSGYDVTVGSAIQDGQTIVPGSINDIVNEFRIGYSTRNIGLTLGHNYRWRECCPNTAQVGNETPTQWHATYLELNYVTNPIAALHGTTFKLTAHETYNLWHNSKAFQASEAAAGIKVNGGTARFPFWYGVNANVPINSGLTVYGFFGFGQFDYFDNSVSPYFYDLADYGIVKSINKYLTFIVSVNSLSQQHLERNNPFAPPNALHRSYLATALRIHLGK
ncbi:MAG: hypothetical protein NVS4B5_18450 [Vulcanimicrobiaceae bacterium]